MVRDTARAFARDRLAPTAASRDRTRAFPTEIIKELASLGLLAAKVPLELGGPGTDNVGYALAMEAIAEGCASTAVILASSNLVAHVLVKLASSEQKERWLRPYARGELGPASFALTEPGAGSDAASLETSARRDGDEWILNGSKMWITSGAEAGLHLVFARTEPGKGARGIGTFIVERGTPGLTVGKEEGKMGLRSSGTVMLHFEDCRVPAANLVGDPASGYKSALGALGAGRVGIAAQCVGIGEAAVAEGLAYAKERRAFDQPIAHFQSSQFALADSRADLDSAWLLMLRAAALLDRGERCQMETSMAKLYASEACGRVVDRMLQLHGGNGYSEEFTIERLYRDARVTRIYEGTSEIQRLIMARSLLGD